MIIVRDAKMLEGKPLVATVGFFDGVHLGHRFLIDELKGVARARNLPSAVITFSEHPRAVLHSDYQPKLLNTFDEKMEMLKTTGVDYCIVIGFTTELSRLSAREFITSVLTREFHVATLLIGYDHRFGHDRTDGFEQYVAYGAACGMEVLKASPFNEGSTAVSSSMIRRLLTACRVEEAARLLTYPYRLRGTIVGGFRVGRTLGFPTANIKVDDPQKEIPGIGVYAVHVFLEEKQYAGMLYIGSRPTFGDDSNLVMEVHILNFSGDIYQRKITVAFERYVRGDIRFSSPDALRHQLEKDREAIVALLA